MPQNNWWLARLSRHHDRERFNCGEPSLDEWLRVYASQFDRRDLARTYVLGEPGDVRVLGYFALANHAINYNELPPQYSRPLPKVDLPTVLLGRLAVDKRLQGQGVGKRLLLEVLSRCERLAAETGILGVEVSALSESAKEFYRSFGFFELLDDPSKLLLTMREIRSLKLSPSEWKPI